MLNCKYMKKGALRQQREETGTMLMKTSETGQQDLVRTETVFFEQNCVSLNSVG